MELGAPPGLDNMKFFDVEPTLFKWIYVGFAALVFISLLLAPPRWRQGKGKQETAASCSVPTGG